MRQCRGKEAGKWGCRLGWGHSSTEPDTQSCSDSRENKQGLIRLEIRNDPVSRSRHSWLAGREVNPKTAQIGGRTARVPISGSNPKLE